LMASSASLSTQENLWLLVSFKAMLGAETPQTLNAAALKPRPADTSANGASADWPDENLANLAGFVVGNLDPANPLYYVLDGSYRTGQLDTPLVSKGLRVERVIKNLTDPARTGTPDAPIKLGDDILISYRMYADAPQSYVAVEDLLPAGIEVVNTNLALFAQTVSVPEQKGIRTADISYSQMLDQKTVLFFDKLYPGAQDYSVLARATAAGAFRWPATQMVPMYDGRFYGRSPSSVCVISPD
jgi:uncharacterized protein YfaS (alpha-2-macroglobulin family)